MTFFDQSDPIWGVLKAIDGEASGQFRNLVAAASLDPKSDFRYAHLVGLPLRNADISGFDFSGSDLRGSELRFAANFDGLIISGDTKLDDDDRSWWIRLKDQVGWSENPYMNYSDELARGARLQIRLFIITEIVLVGLAIGIISLAILLPEDSSFPFAFALTGAPALLGLFVTVVSNHVNARTKARIFAGLGSAYRAPEAGDDDIRHLNDLVRVASSVGAFVNKSFNP